MTVISSTFTEVGDIDGTGSVIIAENALLLTVQDSIFDSNF